MTKAKAIELIQNCLALSNSPNEEEAKTALNKAHELLVRYNMSLEDVKEKMETEKILVEALFGGQRARSGDKWKTQLAAILARHFLVVTVFESAYNERGKRIKRIAVHGRETNVAMFKYALNYLLGVYKNLSKDHLKEVKDPAQSAFLSKRELRKKAKRAMLSYCYGLNISFSETLKAQQDEEAKYGLVPSTGVDMSQFRTAKSRRPQLDANSFAGGLKDGKNIRLRAPIETTTKQSNLMIG